MQHKAILDSSPLPVYVHQDGRIVYANPATIRLCRRLGYDLDEQALMSMDLWRFAAPEERGIGRQNEQRILDSGEPQFNVPRTMLDAAGNRVQALGSVTRVTWKGRPALEVSMVVIEPARSGRSRGARPRKARRLAEPERAPIRHAALMKLTPAERRIVFHLAEGFDTVNILSRLGIKESTFRSHLRSIYRKLGVRSRTGLVRLALGLD